MLKRGDVVRLNRGWTPMIVLYVDPDGEVWAVYASRSPDYHITEEHYYFWNIYAQTNRPMSGFTLWDGAPINLEWNYIMTNRYKSIKKPHVSGVFLNTSSQGKIIIETDIGDIVVLDPEDATRDIPTTFRVKGMGSNYYTANYILPDGVDIAEGDMLISETNNVYVVTEMNTEALNNKGLFKGSRVVKSPL